MKLICPLLFLILCVQLFAQPKWIDAQWRKAQYPDALYLVGYASEQNKAATQSELLPKLEGFAKSRLSESVLVSITSLIDMNLTETNSGVNEYVRKNCLSNSNIRLAGLKTEQYYNPKTKTGYAMVYAKKEDVANLYKRMITEKADAIHQNTVQAQQLENAGDKKNALKIYYQTMSMFREAEEAQAIYVALKQNINDEDAAIGRLISLKNTVENGIITISNSKHLSIDDACFLLAQAYYVQTGDMAASIRLTPFTYRDTKMGSAFSRAFARSFEQQLITEARYGITTQGNYQPGTESQTPYTITGTYWEEGNTIRVISVMRDMNYKAIAGAEICISTSGLDSLKISAQPENFVDAYAEMQVFKKDEVINGDLLTELWTNKGDENLIFAEGERMKVYVRVNKECHLRLTYYLADGSKVLLLNDYYIDASKINRVYEIPYEFECSPPFGTEILQLNAQTSAFPDLKTSIFDGYTIIEETTDEILAKNRGMKRVDDPILRSEKRLIVSTMAF